MELSKHGKKKLLRLVFGRWSGKEALSIYKKIEDLLTNYEPGGFDFDGDDRFEFLEMALADKGATGAEETYKQIVDLLAGDGTKKTENEAALSAETDT